MTSILNINKNDNKKTMFLCSVCKNSYPDKEQLKNHMIKVSQFLKLILNIKQFQIQF